jgi:hypothetical protein
LVNYINDVIHFFLLCELYTYIIWKINFNVDKIIYKS